jgi:hypothetical protein
MSDHPTKRVSQEELNKEFDNNNWLDRLREITPHEIYHRPAPSSHGFPPGTVTMVHEYKDTDGREIALVAKHVTPKGEFCGGREHHPSSLLVDGITLHT